MYLTHLPEVIAAYFARIACSGGGGGEGIDAGGSAWDLNCVLREGIDLFRRGRMRRRGEDLSECDVGAVPEKMKWPFPVGAFD